MIYESRYWKDDLLKITEKLRRRLIQKRWPGSARASLEKEIMLGFYSIRKLIESHKISNHLFEENRAITAYPRKKSHMTLINWHKIDKHFNLQAPQKVNRNLSFICNKVIHSYVFVPCFGRRNFLKSVLVTSDVERQNYLYELSIRGIIKFFNDIGNNYPSESHSVYCKEIKDYKVFNK